MRPLRHAYAEGRHAALVKLGLNPPTQVDEFIANVENGKDVPPDHSTDVPQDAPALPQTPGTALGTPGGLPGA